MRTTVTCTVELVCDGVDWICVLRLEDGRTLEAYGPGEDGALAAMQALLDHLTATGELNPLILVRDRN